MKPDTPKTRVGAVDNTYVTVFSHSVTLNEIHAAEMGLVGLLFGTVAALGAAEVRLFSDMVTVFLVAYAIIGDPALHSLPHDADEYIRTVGLQTIKYEPWWFLLPFTLTYVLSRVIAAAGYLT